MSKRVYGSVRIDKRGPCPACNRDRGLEMILVTVAEDLDAAEKDSRRLASQTDVSHVSTLYWSPVDGLCRERQHGTKHGEYDCSVPGAFEDRERIALLLSAYWFRVYGPCDQGGPCVDTPNAAAVLTTTDTPGF